MNDINLLKLAAKAAGLPPEGMEGGEGGPISKGGLVWSGNGKCIDWNPLTDDGDALRLAVKLDLAIIPFPIYSTPKHGVTVKLYRNSAAIYRGREKNFEEDVMHEGDAFAATRRAIVLAAAAIGQAM